MFFSFRFTALKYKYYYSSLYWHKFCTLVTSIYTVYAFLSLMTWQWHKIELSSPSLISTYLHSIIIYALSKKKVQRKLQTENLDASRTILDDNHFLYAAMNYDFYKTGQILEEKHSLMTYWLPEQKISALKL